MSTRREHHLEGCLFSVTSYPDEIALKYQLAFLDAQGNELIGEINIKKDNFFINVALSE